MKALPLLFLLSLWTNISFAAPINGLDFLPYGSRAAISYGDFDQPATHRNGDQLLPPASTLKILTALSAKLVLDDDFRFSTELLVDDKDLFLRFGGDPTLSREDLKRLLLVYKKKHGRLISGNIYLDGRAFTGYEKGIGWPWDNLGVCYSAPSSVVTLDSNCIQGSIYSQENGKTRVYVPPHHPIEVSTEAVTVTKDQQTAQYCDLELTTFANTYRLAGCIAEREKPLPLKFAIQDTRSYASATLRSLLAELDMLHQGVIVPKAKLDTPDNLILVAAHHSAPLPELLGVMLKESDNLIADNLIKAVGGYYFNAPGSFSNGTAAMAAVLEEATHTDFSTAQLFDGSGLSRNNKLTGRQLGAALEYIWKNDEQLNLIGLLPRSGMEGTLKYRSSMRSPQIKGHMAAKSGSLFGSVNMAGFVVDEQGKPKRWFVQLIADYHPAKPKPGEPRVEAPFISFEKAFYQQLVN